MRYSARRGRPGIALGVVILTATIFSVAAYAVLAIAIGLRARIDFSKRNVRARYAAEAGMVWGMQQLWANPTWASPLGTVDHWFDSDGDGVNETAIDIILPACTQVPCESRQMAARVVSY